MTDSVGADGTRHPAWRVLESTLVLSAPPWLSIYRDRVALPDGTLLDGYYRLRLPDGVLVVAVTAGNEVVAVRGYKHGAMRTVLSLPSGIIEPGESPLDTAARELLEETGYVASGWSSLGAFLVEPARQYTVAHVVVARNARRAAAAREDASERFDVELVPLSRFLATIRGAEDVSLAMVAAVSLALLHGDAGDLRQPSG